jgi:hypothetical protein
MAALRRAKCVVSADTGPLHLASALKTPVVGLFGPTDPARNGPYSTDDVVVRNPQFGETTYRRGASYSPAMLSISVDQVVEAVQRRLGLREPAAKVLDALARSSGLSSGGSLLAFGYSNTALDRDRSSGGGGWIDRSRGGLGTTAKE